MYRCVLLCDAGATPSELLLKFIQRTGFLELVWAGAYTDLAPAQSPAAGWDLVFASLPAPDQPSLAPYQAFLRQQEALILSSSYPAQLYSQDAWPLVTFLTEPFSFGQFQHALQQYVDSGLARR